MAEQSGKGIALVILGIVAIIAIVGLVLLFTGYKGASGQFAVPAEKAYGGAIRGVLDPYSRAFAGRAFNQDTLYPTDAEGVVYSAQGSTGKGSPVAHGDYSGPTGEQTDMRKSFERDDREVASVTCERVGLLTFGDANAFPVDASVQEFNAFGGDVENGGNCIVLEKLFSQTQEVQAGAYGIWQNQIRQIGLDPSAMHKSSYACCRMPSARTGGAVVGSTGGSYWS